MEPLPLNSVRAAAFNPVVAAINAALVRGASRGNRTVAVLDAAEIVADRPGCVEEDGLHWGQNTQAAKATAFLHFSAATVKYRPSRNLSCTSYEEPSGGTTIPDSLQSSGKSKAQGSQTPMDGLRQFRARLKAADNWRQSVAEYWSRWTDQVRRADGEFSANHLPEEEREACTMSDGEDNGLRVGPGGMHLENWWSVEGVPGKDGDEFAADVLSTDDKADIRVWRVGLCGEIAGGELGYWRRRRGAEPTYRLRDCILRRFSRESARSCVAGNHLLVMGDSISRFQYLSLVSLLHHGFPESSGTPWRLRHASRRGGLGADEEFNLCLHATRWEDFFLQSSAKLGGKEWCDCFRAEQRFLESAHVENRYFSLLPDEDISVSFIQVLGFNQLWGNNPGGCGHRAAKELTCALKGF